MVPLTLLAALALPSWAAEAPEDSTQKAAEAWLKVVDEGEYGASCKLIGKRESHATV